MIFAIPTEAEVAIQTLNIERTKAGKKEVPKFVALSAMTIHASKAGGWEELADRLLENGKAPNPRRKSEEKKK